MRDYDEFCKVAKAADPMKKGYIVKETIKGGIKGGLQTEPLALPLAAPGILMSVARSAGKDGHCVDSKKADKGVILSVLGATAVGGAIGAKAGASEARKDATEKRIRANFSSADKQRLDMLGDERTRAELDEEEISREHGVKYGMPPAEPDGTIEHPITGERIAGKAAKRIIRSQERSMRANSAFNNFENEAYARSKADLVNKGLISKKFKDIKPSFPY